VLGNVSEGIWVRLPKKLIRKCKAKSGEAEEKNGGQMECWNGWVFKWNT
jgi:hypothetical protein